jgi:thiol-disulfide isomerase/thioredoxin
MSKKRFVLVMLGVLSVLGASAFLQEKLGPGVAAPDFELENLEGKPVKLSELKGKPVFLDFWATWCGPCRRALPHTQEFAKKYKDKAHILAINVRESKEKVQQFMEQNKYTFPVLLDTKGEVARAYQVSGIPHFVIIDAEGKIQLIKVGYGAGMEKELERALQRAIDLAEQKRQTSTQ